MDADKLVTKQQWKEKLGLKSRKCKRDNEEEYQEIDDKDRDPDYQLDKDPEVDFIAEDADIEGDEDTFKIEKHVHAINLQESGDYVIEIRHYVQGFAKTV